MTDNIKTGACEDRTPQYVRCGSCDHQWIGFYLPIEVTMLSKIGGGMRCPSCGGDSRDIFLSDGEDDA